MSSGHDVYLLLKWHISGKRKPKTIAKPTRAIANKKRKVRKSARTLDSESEASAGDGDDSEYEP